jgi:prolipoprotein diacylglyceryltransferase
VRPVLFELGGVPVPSYAVFVTLGLLCAAWVRRREVARLGYHREAGHAAVGLGALLGGLVGSKLGMLLFVGPADLRELGLAALTGDFTGKTVVGGLAGGYLGVELTKRLVGIRHSTGDGFAVSMPLAQGIGRIGCFFHGCCIGLPWDGPLAVTIAGVPRHPAQLYESAADLALAGTLWAVRRRPRTEGHLFKAALVGYAAIRFVLEPLRGDQGWKIGPLTAVQVVCALTIVGFGAVLARGNPRRSGAEEAAG